MTDETDSKNSSLPVILLAAVVQGWVLYALHHSIKGAHWPATQPAWLFASYAVAVFAPPLVYLMAEHARRRALWCIVGPVALAFGYFGWCYGARIGGGGEGGFAGSGDWFALAFALGVLWFHLTPFIQYRLAEGRWRARYEFLFAAAWRNALMLAEAALFTGLLWLLLFLWGKLFKMLGIEFFSELFKEPIFVYPVTALAFGFALHLIGSIERLTNAVLTQVLNVLKWLAILAGLILALFTVALLFKLPRMAASGERAIDAAWLLWLVAVTVLLVNAAFRDGRVATPYPRAIAFAMRCVIPLIVVIAFTALYALYVRVDLYGLTVERVWGCVVAAVACLYAIGYSLAARRSSPWMAGVARVNIFAACFLIGVIALTSTPILSPHRIAANSQFERVLRSTPDPDTKVAPYTASMHYLRFDAGLYGAERLRALASLQAHPQASQIRDAANAMIAREGRWQAPAPVHLVKRLKEMTLYPVGSTMDASLLAQLDADLRSPAADWPFIRETTTLAGVFADLNADEVAEFVLIAPPAALVFEHRDGQWRRVGVMSAEPFDRDDDPAAALKKGDVAVQAPVWRDLKIGRRKFRMDKQ